MANRRLCPTEAGDNDDAAAATLLSYPCSLYFVQSPSNASHSDHSTGEAASAGRHPSSHSASGLHQLVISGYSSPSSGDSNNSFLNDKKLERGMGLMSGGSSASIRALRHGVGEEEEGEERGLMAKAVVFDSKESLCCLAFQLAWRLGVSSALALLVFFLATKPPAPGFSFKILNVRHFSLGEGVDGTGVPTELLSCNCSVQMEVDNKSNFFGLHIHPPQLQLSFGLLQFASSHGQASYVESASSSLRQFFVGVKDRPVYGAGRSMRDLLESRQDLPLIVRVRTGSSYRAVWDWIKIKHHRNEDCIVVLHGMDGPRLSAKMYNSTCIQS